MTSPSSKATAIPAKTGTGRIPIFEGLRAYLGWWVVGCHVLAECGFESRFLPGILKVMRGGGGAAVNIFVILSGFVIMHLLTTKHESYRIFIARRFFRLYPAFITAVVIGAIFLPQITELYSYLSTQIYPDVEVMESLSLNYGSHFWGYLLASITMFHGAIPHAWLPHAQAAFISPGWSISLEWQFYLVIPFILFGFRRFPLLILTGIVALDSASQLWAIGEWGSFLPQHGSYFLIGCLSYLVYNKLPVGAIAGPLPLTVWTAALLWLVSPDWRGMLTGSYDFTIGPWLSVGIWLLVLSIALDNRSEVGGKPMRWITYIFTNRVAQVLGMVSFSTYLFHYFALFIGLSVFRSLDLPVNKYQVCAIALPVTIIVTLIFSFIVHYAVEKPGMRLGHLIAKKI